MRPTDKGSPSPGFTPIAPEDLAKLGIEPQLISLISRAEESLNGSPSFSTTEAENLVEVLDKVHLFPQTRARALNLPTIRSCRPPWRIQA